MMTTAARVNVPPSGDARYLVPLVTRGDYRELEAVYGDKAYLSQQSAHCIYDLGAHPVSNQRRGSKLGFREIGDTRS